MQNSPFFSLFMKIMRNKPSKLMKKVVVPYIFLRYVGSTIFHLNIYTAKFTKYHSAINQIYILNRIKT